MEYTGGSRRQDCRTDGSWLFQLYLAASTYSRHLCFSFSVTRNYQGQRVTEPCAVHELLGPSLLFSLTARTATGFTLLGAGPGTLTTRRVYPQSRGGTRTSCPPHRRSRHWQIASHRELKPSLRERGLLSLKAKSLRTETRAYAPLIDMLKRYCDISDQDSANAYEKTAEDTR
jgi:hypothetical protein